MFELLIAVGVIVGLGTISALIALAPVPFLFGGGFWLIVLGFAFGTPTGLVYHIALYRTLHPRGQLPPRWWLRPNRHHHALRDDERFRVLVWFALGAIGYVVIVGGCVMLAAAALRGG